MKRLFLMITVSLMMIFGSVCPASARAKIKIIAVTYFMEDKNKTVYYDIGGSSAKEKIQFKMGEYALSVVINGKNALKLSKKGWPLYHYDYSYIKLKNGKKFLYVSYGSDNYVGPRGIYKYTGGRLKRVADFNILPGLNKKYSDKLSYDNHVTSIHQKGNSIIITIEGIIAQLSLTKFSVKYTYKSGKMKRAKTGTIVKIDCGLKRKKLKTNKYIPLYKSRSTKRRITIIPKNKKVTLKKISGKNKKLWVKVKYGKKSGWIKLKSQYNSDTFKNILYPA